MDIIPITPENLDAHLAALIALNGEFLKLVCDQAPRGHDEGREVLQQMVANAPTTGVLLARNADGEAVGLSYYNYGTGYSCGGVYLWLNCIYIRAEHQRKGYGSRLLEHIIAEGRERGMKLFTCSRHLDNDASRRLFARGGFTQEESVSMSKTFE